MIENDTPEMKIFRIIPMHEDDWSAVEWYNTIEERAIGHLPIHMPVADVEAAIFDFLKTGKLVERVRGKERLMVYRPKPSSDDVWINTPSGRFAVPLARLTAYSLERKAA